MTFQSASHYHCTLTFSSVLWSRRLLPSVGYITIMMNDYPYLKFALIGLLGLLVITNKDS